MQRFSTGHQIQIPVLYLALTQCFRVKRRKKSLEPGCKATLEKGGIHHARKPTRLSVRKQNPFIGRSSTRLNKSATVLFFHTNLMQMVSNSCASLYFSLILLIYFECVTYRLYATVTIFKKRKATPRKNFGHATPLWQTLCNSHISLSQRSRWPLWRSLTVR